MGSAEACIGDASTWATALVERERRRGESDPLAEVARQGRVSRYAIWSLLYRPPKKVAAEVYLSLGTLYADECARQAKLYAEERARTEAKTWVGRNLMRAADRLAGEVVGKASP